MHVVLYGKPDCCLCDFVESRLVALRARKPFDLEKRSILDDPALEARWGTTIPVVEIDGAVVSEGKFDEPAVERMLGIERRGGALRRLLGD